ncbi:hypothetical protein LTR78_010353 [Recurvomyces mirabilis]|uniref:Uncharacterized protein n=1 Tax=Recurvomyces mirabilis TaxID=574656 RepID=A0AAE0TLW9_9PEZI|nr:hypothetical protein LTR78_010353 [Recurvomyces mirabilis]KAK5156207.1 hypothetical protein LTS14_005094 [Recurvomyces mirabilis]
MQKIKKTIEQKLGDHPNVNSNPETQPNSGVGHGSNQGNASDSWVTNKIQSGQGHDRGEGPRAGGTTASDVTSAGQTSGVIGEAPRGTK